MRKPALAAFCVVAGVVFAEASNAVVPPEHLTRPLVAAGLIGIVLGVAAKLAGQYAVIAAAGAAFLIVSPSAMSVLIVTLAALVVVVSRIVGRPVNLAAPVVAASVVFALTGVAQFLPQVDFATRAHAAVDAPPVYLILLDGYPRVDVLEDLGFDNRPFIAAMEERGFEHHADARSLHRRTHRTLTAMLTGKIGPDEKGSAAEQRALRESWRLPAGFVAVAPPFSHVTLPDAPTIGGGGISNFDTHLVRASLFAPILGDFLLDAWRAQVTGALETVATTEHRRVFAHIAAPHAPYLYAPDGDQLGAPDCWPECSLPSDLPVSDTGLVGTVAWLNGRLVEVVDSVLDRHPEAVVALFGDHGAKLIDGPTDADLKPLLLTRGLDLDEPRPDRILSTLPRLP